MDFRPCSPLEPPAVVLLAEMVAEMKSLYRIPEDRMIGVPLHPEEMAPPSGVYLVGWEGDHPAAGGGVRLIGPEMAEIKRMYVRPPFRGRGRARALLEALEREAGRLGAVIVRLDTGPRQPQAQGLYERSGYRAIGNWNANPDASFWGEKRLVS